MARRKKLGARTEKKVKKPKSDSGLVCACGYGKRLPIRYGAVFQNMVSGLYNYCMPVEIRNMLPFGKTTHCPVHSDKNL